MQFVAVRFVRYGEQSGQNEDDKQCADQRAARHEEGYFLDYEVGGREADAEACARHYESGGKHGHDRTRSGSVRRLSRLPCLAEIAVLRGDENGVVHRCAELHRADDEVGHKVDFAACEYVLHYEVEEDTELDERYQKYGALETAQGEYEYDEYRRDGNARNQREVGGGDGGEVVGALRISREVATHGSVVGVFRRDQPALAENFVGNGLDFVENVETGLTFVVDFGVGYADGVHGVTAVDIALEGVEVSLHIVAVAHHSGEIAYARARYAFVAHSVTVGVLNYVADCRDESAQGGVIIPIVGVEVKTRVLICVEQAQELAEVEFHSAETDRTAFGEHDIHSEHEGNLVDGDIFALVFHGDLLGTESLEFFEEFVVFFYEIVFDAVRIREIVGHDDHELIAESLRHLMFV